MFTKTMKVVVGCGSLALGACNEPGRDGANQPEVAEGAHEATGPSGEAPRAGGEGERVSALQVLGRRVMLSPDFSQSSILVRGIGDTPVASLFEEGEGGAAEVERKGTLEVLGVRVMQSPDPSSGVVQGIGDTPVADLLEEDRAEGAVGGARVRAPKVLGERVKPSPDASKESLVVQGIGGSPVEDLLD